MRNSSLDQSLEEARFIYADKRPETRRIHEEACESMPGGNTRTVLYHGPFPLRALKGKGAFITDVDGHEYLNLLGEYTAGVFGHSNPEIVRELKNTLDCGLNLGAQNAGEPKLASLVTQRFPAIEKVRFTNSGTEANLMALSTARVFTNRKDVMVFCGGYHGGLLYFGGDGLPINAPFPYVVAAYNDFDATRGLIAAHAETLACVIVEPMLGSSGCIPGKPEFLQMLRDETERAGALLIFDEVMTSRFGRHGASDLLGITPDMMTLGKWVGGGMSFGAFGGRSDIMDIYDPTKPGTLPHAGTFNNNVLSMSGGVAALSSAFTSDKAEALHTRGERIRERLNDLFESHGAALFASGSGSLMNIHPVNGPVSSVDDIAGGDERIKELLFLDLLDRGIYVAKRGFIALSLAVSDDDLDRFVSALDDIISVRRLLLPVRAGQ
ncbi:MAG: aminotransferase class III-fold pyridoxal phosphate-dependent enzyme [Hyphomicrobiales bacterium]|nr:aminotransferase class III-fold pyridoxal phosphate-dependent enzyme [Hyphomicrobiales bacterium]